MWGKRSNQVSDQDQYHRVHRVLQLISLLSAVLILFFLPSTLIAERKLCVIMIISTVFDTVLIPNERKDSSSHRDLFPVLSEPGNHHKTPEYRVDLFPSHENGPNQILRDLALNRPDKPETHDKQASPQPHFCEIEQHAFSPRQENQKHEQQDPAQGCSPAQDQKAITSQHDYFEHVEGSPQIFTGPVYIQQGSPKLRTGKQTKTDENTKA